MKNYKIFFALLLLVVFTGCSSDKKPAIPATGFGKYVHAFTSGTVSVESSVKVHLAKPVTRSNFNTGDLFQFSPEINGKTEITGDRIIEFRPSEQLQPGTIYTAKFNLGELLDVEPEFNEMTFRFSTIKQSFSVTFEGLKNYDAGPFDKMQFTGYVLTADVADPAETEKILQAEYENQNLPVEWTHDPDRRKHFFTVDSLQRFRDKSGELVIYWNGKPLELTETGTEKFEVPALNVFKVLEASVVPLPEQHIEVRFSDPLLKSQDLTGMISLGDGTALRLSIDGNVVKGYPAKTLTGEIDVTISEGIENVNYFDLEKSEKFRVQFNSLKPQVKLIGNGVIVPQRGSLEIPFEAVSLSAVEIQVVQIFKDNVLTFFQENQFDGSADLKKSGRLVYSGEVKLNPKEPGGLLKWNTYKINLAEFFPIEQGAIYNVQIRFHKEYSLYSCNQSTDREGNELKETSIKQEEPYQTEWDRPGWYSNNYYPSGYNWQERDNPCNVSYFNSSRFVERNIFASELGIIAKEGRDHEWNFAVSNLISTSPGQNVELRLLNFQNQEMQKVATDNNGFASVVLSRKPFLLVAQKGKQFGYLRLDDGSALSTSNFNVSGQKITDGLKAFIYGERGVWRPGDTLFLNVIVEKENAGLPADYPVIFQFINPSGQVVEKQVLTENHNGFYSMLIKTDSDAPTGNWQAQVSIGNATFSKRIKIETVKPNRLKINLDLPAAALTQKTEKIPLEASWLHGSPARSLKAKIDVLFVKDNTEFEGFENYSFTDPASSFSPSEQTIFEGQLDENGKTMVPVDFKSLENAPGMVKGWFTTRIFEQGGNFSINTEQANFAPFSTFVGVKMPASEDNWYKTDTDYYPEIVLVDANGNPVSGDKLQVKLYKIDWRWWWESGAENLAHYVSGNHYRPVETWNIENAEEKNRLKLNVKYNNWQDNGRYLLWVKDITSGHAAGVTFYMSKWGSWRSDGMAGGATLLTIRTDKEKYSVGEKMEVTIPSSKAGKALVSIENGTDVTDIFWVETEEKQTRFSIDITPEMAPNFYVHVSLIQPYGQTKNDAPLRLYGIAPVTVENPATVLLPVIETPAEIEPEKDYTITVSEANGKEMTYTLAIVDEGLLGLTNFKTPNPHDAFYAREALGVKTWDLYDEVAGAYGARLEKAFAVGGDAEISASAKKEANRFKPVVRFAGPFTVKNGESRKHNFTMSNYVGAVRAMVVAGNNGAYGSTEKTVPVRKGLMLLTTMPRVLAPEEEVSLPVNIFAMKENVKNVSVQVKTNALLQISGEVEKTVQFENTGEKMTFFRLKAQSDTGVGKVFIEAVSGSERATYEIELEIRNPNSPVTVEQTKMVEVSQNWQTSLQVPGDAVSATAWIEVYGFPPLNLTKHIDYLTGYPHGCIEQITSAAFPQLFLGNLTVLSANDKQEIEDNIRGALQKLALYQLPDGGFGYWPGASSADEWCTTYAGHFMLKAEEAGYSLPLGVKENWLNFQQTTARNWNSSHSYRNGVYFRNYDFTQAYRLYSLALAGAPDLGAMNRLRGKSEKSAEASWRLAAAYILAGQPEAAQQLVRNLTTKIDAYQEMSGTFGSALRDKAMILETLVLMDEKEQAFQLLKTISDEMNNSNWLSTQTAAWCLSAAAKYAGEYSGENSETRFELKANGQKTSLRSAVPITTIPVELTADGNVQVDFANRGDESCFVKVLGRGVPVGTDTSSASQNLLMHINYFDTADREIDPSALQQGVDFRLEVTLKNPGLTKDYEEMVLSTVFPSGYEIMNNRLNDIPQEKNSTYEYQDIRDDRVYTYFDLGMNQQKTFVFYLNAAYAGEFYYPPVSCEAMYDVSVRAQEPGRWVEVLSE
jgi:uncharacterized protein YfaS (alpha-2-macroglobulin family)